jgi:Flp pilus assembly pilin Flp
VSRRPGPPAGALGQGLVEYGLIIGLSAALALVILVVFGDQVADVVQWIARVVAGAD